GISGVDITTVLFDTAPEPAPTPRPPVPWTAKPLPGAAKLLGEALRERATVPGEMTRGVRAMLRAPRKAVSRVAGGLTSIGATAPAAINAPAPETPSNVQIGPPPRVTFSHSSPARFQAARYSISGTPT